MRRFYNSILGQRGKPRDFFWLDTGNGHGSTNTKIRRWTNTTKSNGKALFYSDSGTAGGTVTIMAAGIYAINYQDSYSAGVSYYGLSLNSTELTTDINNITMADALGFIRASNSGGTQLHMVSWTGFLAGGDVIRAHTDGNPDGGGIASLRIERIG